MDRQQQFYQQEIAPSFHVPINVSASGATLVIPGLSNHVVRIMGFLVVAAAAVTVSFQDEDANQVIGPMAFADNGGAAPSSSRGLGETSTPGVGVEIVLSGSVQVGGSVCYEYRRADGGY